MKGGENITQVIAKISKRSYKLLKSVAQNKGFIKESYYKDGFYYIEIDELIYKALLKMDSDIDKTIFYLVLNQRIKESKK